jgi:pyrroloquinoline-quinone synthase
MTFVEELNQALSEFNLLNHPYYQAWNEGTLTRKDLQKYASQYFPHVEAFPRYISAIHSQCTNIKDRQILLDNLIDEERGDENHPELWLRFAEGLGATRETVLQTQPNEETQEMLTIFEENSKASYAEGLTSLYAYERQIPEIAHVKIEGLKKFYDLSDEKSLRFFEVHKSADVYHSQACADMIEKLPEQDRAKAKVAAIRAAKSLWKFLDGVYNDLPKAA